MNDRPKLGGVEQAIEPIEDRHDFLSRLLERGE
jgi:hypothetical protein